MERLVGQLFERDRVDVPADAQVAVVAFDVARRQSRDFGAHCVVIAAVGEVPAVGEVDPVERIVGPQFDVVGHPLAAKRPEFLEHVRRRDDRRARVEREPVLVVRVGTTARRIEPIEHGDAIALRAEADTCGESADAGADDDDVRSIVAGHGRALESGGCQSRGIHGLAILGQSQRARLFAEVHDCLDWFAIGRAGRCRRLCKFRGLKQTALSRDTEE